MADTKLKPCPFCGGLGALNREEHRIFSYVKCKSCGAETGLQKVSAEYCSDEKAIEAWNKRAEETAIPTSTKEEALEPEYEGDGYDDNGEIVYDAAYCPICHQYYEFDYDDHDNYCRNCGQKLDWRRVETGGGR